MNTENERFAVFILTHGRPNKVITYNTLRKQGYTGDVFIVIDNEDKTGDEYRRIYGDKVIVFDKADIAARFDEGDNFNDRRAVFYARNACFDIARNLGVDYFLQLDDDYTAFVHKFDSRLVYAERRAKNLDALFALVLDYYKSIDAVTIAFAQNGDFLGGSGSGEAKTLHVKRKAMNSFFCSASRPFLFVGRVNEDVNTYVLRGHRGELIFSIFNHAIIQMQTQQNTGGMTEMYLDSGTFIKSFYTVMYAPSCTRVSETCNNHRRIHHRIKWDNAVPCIVAEHHRKADLG